MLASIVFPFHNFFKPSDPFLIFNTTFTVFFFFSFPFLPFSTAFSFFNIYKLVLYLRGGPQVYQFLTVICHPHK